METRINQDIEMMNRHVSNAVEALSTIQRRSQERLNANVDETNPRVVDFRVNEDGTIDLDGLRTVIDTEFGNNADTAYNLLNQRRDIDNINSIYDLYVKSKLFNDVETNFNSRIGEVTNDGTIKLLANNDGERDVEIKVQRTDNPNKIILVDDKTKAEINVSIDNEGSFVANIKNMTDVDTLSKLFRKNGNASSILPSYMKLNDEVKVPLNRQELVTIQKDGLSNYIQSIDTITARSQSGSMTNENWNNVTNNVSNFEELKQIESRLKLNIDKVKIGNNGKILKDSVTKPLFELVDKSLKIAKDNFDTVKKKLFTDISKKYNVSLDISLLDGTKIDDPCMKSLSSFADRLYRNLNRKGIDPILVKDWIRGTYIFSSENINKVKNIIADLKQYITKIDVKDDDGYKGIHLNLSYEGIPVEIQLHTKESWKLKTESDLFYEKYRSIDISKLSLEQVQEKNKLEKLYIQKWNYLLDNQEFKALRAEVSSLNDSKSSSLGSSSQPYKGEDTSFQTPSLNSLKGQEDVSINRAEGVKIKGLSIDVTSSSNNNITQNITNSSKNNILDGISPQLYKALNPDADIPASLINNYNQGKNRQYITLTDSKQIINEVKDTLTNALKNKGVDFKLTTDLDKLAKQMHRDFNLFSSHNAKDPIAPVNRLVDSFVDEITKSKIAYESDNVNQVATLNDFIDEDFKSDLKTIISNLIKDYGRDTKATKLSADIEELKDRLIEGKRYASNRIRLNVESMNQINSIKKYFEDTKKYTLSGTMPVEEINLYKKFVSGLRMSKTSMSVSPKSVEHLIENFKDYTPDNYGDSVLGFNETLRYIIDDLASTYKGESVMLNNEQIAAFNSVLKIIKHDMRELQSSIGQQRLKRARSGIQLANITAKVFNNKKQSKIKSTVKKLVNYAVAPGRIIENTLGRNHPLSVFWRKDVVDGYNKQIGLETDFNNQIYNTIASKNNISVRKIIKEAYNTTIDYLGYKFTVGEIADMKYIYETNKENVLKAGYTRINEKTDTKSLIKFTDEQYQELFNKLPEQMKKYTDAIVKEVFNGTAKELVSSEFKRQTGVELNTIQGTYYPTSRTGDNFNGINAENKQIMSLLSKYGFLKSRTNSNRSQFQISNFFDKVDSYIHDISYMAGMGDAVKDFSVLLNTRDESGRNLNSYLAQVIPNWNSEVLPYMADILYDRPLNNSKSDLLTKIVNNSAFARIGGNLSTMLKQTLSSLSYMYDSEVTLGDNLKAIGKGLFNIFKANARTRELAENNPYLNQRFNTPNAYDSTMAKGAHDAQWDLKHPILSKVIGVLSWGMDTMDRMVNVTVGYEIARDLAIRELGKNASETEIKKLTAEILSKLVIRTQSNNARSEMSMLRAGRKGALAKLLLGGVFGSDNSMRTGFVDELLGGYSTARERINAIDEEIKLYDDIKDYEARKENGTINDGQEHRINTEEEYEKAKEQSSIKNDEDYESIKEAQSKDKNYYSNSKRTKKIVQGAMSMALMGIASVLIADFISKVKGYKDWDDAIAEDGGQLVTDVLLQAYVSWMPYVGNLVNSLTNNYDLSIMTLDDINNLLDSISKLGTIVDSNVSIQEKIKVVKDISFSIATMFGIPADNIYDYFMGALGLINPSYRDSIKYFINSTSSSEMKTDYNDYIENGRTEQAKSTLSTYLYTYSISQNESVLNELVRLSQEGFSAIPRLNPTQYEDDKGNKIKLTAQQTSSFQRLYSKASSEASKMVASKEYQQLTDNDKASSLTRLYNSYYDFAKASILKTDSSTKISRIVSITNGELGLGEYLSYVSYLQNIQASKNKTKQEIILEYLNKDRSLSRADRLFILYLLGYSLSDTSARSVETLLIRSSASIKEARELLEA